MGIFDPIWTRFGPGSGPRVRVRLWTRVSDPGLDALVLWPLVLFACYTGCFVRKITKEVLKQCIFDLKSWEPIHN